MFCYVIKILTDVNRTSYVGFILYDNGLISSIILSGNLLFGSIIYSGLPLFKNNNSITQSFKEGWAIPLSFIKVFSIINNIELKPFYGSKLIRSAGTRCMLISKTMNKVVLKLNSGWQLVVNQNCLAVLGIVSNYSKKFNVIGSAGLNRNYGFKPKVRGVAKNPCDHPHGGGNGKKSPPVILFQLGAVSQKAVLVMVQRIIC